MSDVALIIIYNHQYNKNIARLESMYGDRFSNIYHLVPFYQGNQPNVIPVYENSFYFQGYVSQGLKHFFKKEYKHYFFIGDDLIVNPLVNEQNYTTYLKLDDTSCFFPYFIHMQEPNWWWRKSQALSYNIALEGVEVKAQLPTYEQAAAKFAEKGFDTSPIDFDVLRKYPNSIKGWLQTMRHQPFLPIGYWYKKRKKKKRHLPYPLIGGYADLFVISADTIQQFAHYCGAFAATELFVEIAIPTALILTAKQIITENDITLKGEALWNQEDFKKLEHYNNDLTKLLKEFPANNLYLHPVKLSQWK